MRACCSATISFGLVSIPTKAYLTASAETFSFNMITPKGNRVKQQLVDSVTGDVVDRKDTNKGFEHEKDSYLIFKEEELKALEGDRSDLIDVLQFVSGLAIKPEQVERSLYLSPEKNADRSYKLLLQAMRKTGKVAICKWYTRGKDHLVALQPVGDTLMLHQLYYADEVRSFQVPINKNSDPTDKEIELGEKLIAMLSVDTFDHSSHVDQYGERFKAAVVRKQAGETVTVMAQLPAASGALDLAALLMGSMNAVPVPVLAK
jgi:DNA end-binding protein Ku